MRLDKYLADMSLGTRSQVKDLIRNKKITVNGIIITKADYQVNTQDKIIYEQQEISYLEYEYIMLNKPSGYLCALEDKKEKVIMSLISSRRKDLVPVGRLDKDSEGLILITNDGQLNHALLNDHKVFKKYYVKTDKKIPDDAGEIFAKGMTFKEFVSLPAKYEKIDDYSAYLSIAEGKYHQVKRMFHGIGTDVIYLRRESFGPLELDDLKTGQSRPLSKEEIEALKEAVR